MENYKDKIEVGIRNPVMVDRLKISSTIYGFNMYDRKNKKFLLVNKSKETCIDGRDILHNSSFEDFKIFHSEVKDEEVVTNKILISFGKHVDSYYTVPTLTDLHKVCIQLLENRIQMGYFQKGNVTVALDYTEKNIEKMPESFRADALKKLKYNKSSIAGDLEFNKVCDIAKKAVNEKDGYLAWKIVNDRQDYEYERIELIDPIKL